MQNKTYQRGLWTIVVLLSGIGLFAALGHYFFRVPVDVALANNFGPGPAWYTDQLPLYDQHWIVTLLHLVPAALFVLLAPFQLSQHLRQRFLTVHRLIGRSLLLLGLILAIYGMALGMIMPFAGRLEMIVSLIIGTGFIGFGYLGIRAIRQNNIARHRAWMSYMLAMGYTPMTMRVIMVILTDGMGFDGQALFAEFMFSGMVLNIATVYWWLHRKPRQVNALNNGEAYDA